MTLPSPHALNKACIALSTIDPALARAYAKHGRPVWRSREPNYALLGSLITHQQISTKAAKAIWTRITAEFGDDISETDILAASEETLKNCGLSRPKVAHMKSIAEAMVTGKLVLQRVCNAPLSDARKELLAVKGIGPWTAELVLLYASGEMDAFPVGDLGLMEAHCQLGSYTPRMDIKAFTAHAEAWRPYRGVAAHLLWGWLNDRRDEAERAKR